MQQKQKALAIITVGIVMFAAIIAFLYSRSLQISGLAQILPMQKTVAYIEFPTPLENADELKIKLNKTLKIDWTSGVIPWAGEKTAFAFISNEKNALCPLMLTSPRSGKDAYNFLEKYQNSQKQIGQSLLENTTVYSTPVIHFALIGQTFAVTPSKTCLEALIKDNNQPAPKLNTNGAFIKLRKSLTGEYFAYIKMPQGQELIAASIGEYAQNMPDIMADTLAALGISANKYGDKWHGKSYAIFAKEIPQEQGQAYRALTLPFIPQDFDLFVSGQDLAAQIKKMDSLAGLGEKKRLKLKDLINAFAQEYLPGLNFEKDLAPLISKEFSVLASGGKALLVSQIQPDSAQIDALFESFAKNAAALTPRKKQFTLLDGTTAFELVPDSADFQIFKTLFENIEIKGLDLKDDIGLYAAVIQNKLFLSNNLTMLRKAALLAKETAENLRNGEKYKNLLQPILKNPELLGIANLQGAAFGFSKRTFTDHMETSFTLMVE